MNANELMKDVWLPLIQRQAIYSEDKNYLVDNIIQLKMDERLFKIAYIHDDLYILVSEGGDVVRCCREDIEYKVIEEHYNVKDYIIREYIKSERLGRDYSRSDINSSGLY